MSSHPTNDPSSDAKRLFSQYWHERSTTFDSQPQHISQSEEETVAWKGLLNGLTSGRSGLSVLDVGTGTGFLAFLLSEMGHRVTGIDISPGMLARAREKAAELGHDVRFLEEDAERPGFPDETFDVVISRHVLWNLPNPNTAIESWVRVTRPGGVIGIIDSTFAAKGGQWGEKYQEAFEQLPMAGNVEPEKVTALMEQKGLAGIRVEWLDNVVAIKRRTIPDYSDGRYMVSGARPSGASG